MGFPDPFYQQNLPFHAVTVYLCLRGQAIKKNPVSEETGQEAVTLKAGRTSAEMGSCKKTIFLPRRMSAC